MCVESGKFACIEGFGEELDEIVYGGISNWFISFRSLFTVYSAHLSYFIVFFVVIGCGLLSYRHSAENGRKFTQFWWGALVHGIISERGLTAARYWHAQAPIMFMGKQLPLHVVFLYPSILYVAMMAVQRLKLNICTEPAAVGLIAMLMEIPYRMISVKFLHITYHDTDPLYYNKLCGVPWVEIFSALVMASSYVGLYHAVIYYQSRDVSTIWDKSAPKKIETMTTVLCGISSPIVGFIQKILLLHVLNDFFNVNAVSCLFFVVSLYVSYVVCFEPKKVPKCNVEDVGSKSLLFYQVTLYLSCFLCLAFFGKPQNEISIGTHEPTGDCTMLICSRTPLGKETERRQYLCTSDLSQRSNFLYNFDCVPNGAPRKNCVWYTICGTTFRNRANFLVLILSCSMFLLAVYMRTLFEPLRRKKYLCADDVAAKKNFVYNFECLEEGPPSLHAIWYTICGSPIYNRPQFFLNVLSFVILLCTLFSKTLFCDTTQLDAVKRLILRLRSEIQRRTPLRRTRFVRYAEADSHAEEASTPSAAEEVPVGFVLLGNDSNDTPILPSDDDADEDGEKLKTN